MRSRAQKKVKIKKPRLLRGQSGLLQDEGHTLARRVLYSIQFLAAVASCDKLQWLILLMNETSVYSG